MAKHAVDDYADMARDWRREAMREQRRGDRWLMATLVSSAAAIAATLSALSCWARWTCG